MNLSPLTGPCETSQALLLVLVSIFVCLVYKDILSYVSLSRLNHPSTSPSSLPTSLLPLSPSLSLCSLVAPLCLLSRRQTRRVDPSFSNHRCCFFFALAADGHTQGVQRGDDLSGRFSVSMSPSLDFVLEENKAFAQIKNALAGNATVTFQVDVDLACDETFYVADKDTGEVRPFVVGGGCRWRWGWW